MTSRARVGVVLGVAALLRAPLLTKPLFDSDEAIYAAIAALLNDGGRLYAEGGVDNKFPGIYYAYAAVFRLFGPYSMGAVHVLSILFVLATCLVLGRIAERIGGERPAWMAALLYGVLTTFYYPKMLAANTELFMTLPLAASVLLSLSDSRAERPRAAALVAAGALIGVATLFRQLAILNLALSSGVALVSGRRGPGRLALAVLPVAGFVAVFGVLFGVYAANGNLDDFLQWAVRAAGTRYLPIGWAYHYPARDVLAMVGVMIVPLTLTALRARRPGPRVFAEWIVFFWLLLGLAAILVLWRFHPHYVIHAVAPLSVLAALELHARLREGPAGARRRTAWLAGGILAVMSVVFFVLSLVLEPVAGGFYPPRPDYPRVARYVHDRTRQGERIFVWGAYAPLYVLADRLPASRFVGFMRGCPRVSAIPLSACWDSGPEVWPLLEKDLTATPPELILDTAAANYGDFAIYPMSDVPVLRDLVASRYELESRVDGVPVYRRR